MDKLLAIEDKWWQVLRPRVSSKLQQEIDTRLHRWKNLRKSQVIQVSATSGHPIAVLVRRPGLTPRPLDPLFFEVIEPTS